MNEIGNYHEKVEQVMAFPVTRKEFLKHLGLAAVGMLGITSVLRSLHLSTLGSLNHTPRQVHGFGSGQYGR